MIFNIPEWPAASVVDHYATTWVLTRDLAGTQEEARLDEDTTHLNSWEVSTIIPTGDIWYVSALRHFKDGTGNIIPNNTPIGPKPVFNEASNVNDYLAPVFEIEEPYVTDITYDQGVSLTLTVLPYTGNVAYERTLVSLVDADNNIITTKFVDITGSQDIVFDTGDIDFDAYDKIAIYIAHDGNHSATSPVYFELVDLRSVIYTISGNTKNLDPNTPNKIIVMATTAVGIEVVGARLLTLDDEYIEDAPFEGNVITVPGIVDFNKSYKLEFILEYYNDQGILTNLTDVIIITTMKTEEADTIQPDHIFDYEFTDKGPYDDYEVAPTVNSLIRFNTEEFFTYLTPLPSNGKISLYTFDKENDVIDKYKEDVLDHDLGYVLRLVTKDKGYIATRAGDELTVQLFDYDSYTDVITPTTGFIPTGLYANTNHTNAVVELADGLYVVGRDLNDNKLLRVLKLDMDGTITEKARYLSTKNMKQATAAALDYDKIMIFPKGGTQPKTYVYTSNDNYITTSIGMPAAFVNKKLTAIRLRNGNIAVFKLNDTSPDTLDMFYYDIKQDMMVEVGTVYSGGGAITNVTELRNGNLMFLLRESPTLTKMYLFH